MCAKTVSVTVTVTVSATVTEALVVFKISLDHAKKSFFCSANAVLVKIGRIANEDVVLQLLYSKCRPMPSLMYGLEDCPLVKSDLFSLDFVINRFFTKLFKTNNLDVVKVCQQYFNFEMPSSLWIKHSALFDDKFSNSNNFFLQNYTVFNFIRVSILKFYIPIAILLYAITLCIVYFLIALVSYHFAFAFFVCCISRYIYARAFHVYHKLVNNVFIVMRYFGVI